MNYWNSILDEVLHKDDNSHAFLFTNQGDLTDDMENYATEINSDKKRQSRDLRTYYLGKEYPNIYLTKREAECMFWIVQDYTIGQTALKMGLSARTVEFYVKNMKLKLHCKSKNKLAEKILLSNLLQQLEKEGLRIVRH
jgi:DNA-binding CsgD family transcriptional regulator